jgi:hypothetical protein
VILRKARDEYDTTYAIWSDTGCATGFSVIVTNETRDWIAAMLWRMRKLLRAEIAEPRAHEERQPTP